MKIDLTPVQLELIRSELRAEELRLETVSESRFGWDIVNCKDNIASLNELLTKKQISIYDKY